MNLKVRLIGTVGVLSAFLVPAIGPMTAHAAGPAAVVFSAHANVHNGGVKAVANGTGGSGSYDFTTSGGGICAGASAGGVDAACTLNSPTGSFNNTICGTGDASDTAQVLSTAGNYTIPYKITFVAGVGVIQGTGASIAAGVVQITPTVGDCVTTNVTQFQATGAAVTAG